VTEEVGNERSKQSFYTSPYSALSRDCVSDCPFLSQIPPERVRFVAERVRYLFFGRDTPRCVSDTSFSVQIPLGAGQILCSQRRRTAVWSVGRRR
jgi:hypothetical protein